MNKVRSLLLVAGVLASTVVLPVAQASAASDPSNSGQPTQSAGQSSPNNLAGTEPQQDARMYGGKLIGVYVPAN